ncbi:MAG TPA: tetratricopeptide repeat protein [Chitinophagaceae bacterium]|nr:tetratricopeptide repeat protein [Chitinophagaceae bacterium]
MAKKKIPARTQPAGGVKQRKVQARKTGLKKNVIVPKWVFPIILIVTVLAFLPALRAGFVNWDDPDYVGENNMLIRDLSRLPELLTTSVQGNHHPLTMLSLAINYAISGENAWSYHLLNLVLHLINCLLVFRLAFLLSNKNTIIAFTTAILFGIHPMHVESVAWISERKDVLYGLFFIAGLISYTNYADSGSKNQYILTVLFCILSLLSKPAAVIFPVALFCIDLLRKRKLNVKLIAEKIPFFIFALIVGLLTVFAQKQVGAMGDTYVPAFSEGTLILFGFYGIMMYLIKMVVPFNLSPFYPFPPINEKLSAAYYISPFFFVALAIIFFLTWKKNRSIAFGILFYLVNLLLVLQVFSVGSAVMADRYTYIPYFGIFFAVGWLIDRYAKGNIAKAMYIIAPLALFFGILTFQQSKIWLNGETMWKQAIKVAPSSRGYSALGVLARKAHKNDLALHYYNEALKINMIDNESYTDRGNIYFDQGKLDSAYADYTKALALKPDYYPAMDNMGAQFAVKGNYDSALFYLNKALVLKPDYKHAYSNRALVFMKLNRNEEAIKDWKKVIEYTPDDADAYNTIGICYRTMGKNQEALTPINKAIEIKPDPHFYMNRSYAYSALKNMEQAKKDALVAKQGGIPIDPSYAKSLGVQ